MKLLLLPFLAILAARTTEAGFRCSIGEVVCSASCVTLGQTSGICDSENNCVCSERDVTLEHFRALLPSRCSLGKQFCQSTCHSIGRKDGVCTETQGCECSEERLSPSEFALCAAESTCRLDCQANGRGTGECKGWSCECKSQ